MTHRPPAAALAAPFGRVTVRSLAEIVDAGDRIVPVGDGSAEPVEGDRTTTVEPRGAEPSNAT